MSRRLLQIAWRNPGRTLITVAAIALGYIMLLSVACLLEGLRQQMIESGTRLQLSHMQVHAPDYYPDRSLYKTLGGREGTDVQALLAAMTADSRVRAASPRVYGYDLVGYGDHSAGAELLGVVPGQEQQVTTLHTRMVAGTFLSDQLPKGVIVGENFATTIGATVGSEIVLLAQATDGSTASDLYTIIGFFRTSLDTLDRGLVVMPLSSLQEFLSLAPERIHEVGVILADVTEATAVAATLEARLSKTLPVRVRAWPELAPDLADYVRLQRGSTAVLFFTVFLLAVIGVMNTMFMAVFERTRELGMLMALDMRPPQVVCLILAEMGGLAVVSLILEGGISVPLLWYLQVHGIDLHGFMDEIAIAGGVVKSLWYGRQDFSAYSRATLGLALTALVSALYPAWRAARLRPVEALHRGQA